jgi:hypothetical protein
MERKQVFTTEELNKEYEKKEVYLKSLVDYKANNPLKNKEQLYDELIKQVLKESCGSKIPLPTSLNNVKEELDHKYKYDTLPDYKSDVKEDLPKKLKEKLKNLKKIRDRKENN